MRHRIQSYKFFILLLVVSACQNFKTESKSIQDTGSYTSEEDPVGSMLSDEPYAPPEDCFTNPFMNCFGASLGNYLNAFYLIGDFDRFYAFLNNSSKRRWSKQDIRNWFNEMEFGYQIEAVNLVEEASDIGVLVYESQINNTRGRLMVPYMLENDSAKLYLRTLKVGIEGQYSKRTKEDISGLDNLIEKMDTTLVSLTRPSPNSVSILLSDSVLFKSGEFELSDLGKAAVGSINDALKSISSEGLQVYCDGYADPTPYRQSNGEDVRNNLDLSLLRASSVAQMLIDNRAVPSGQCIPRGFGDHSEKDANRSLKQRRRVEVILIY